MEDNVVFLKLETCLIPSLFLKQKNAKKPPMKINSFQIQNHCSTDKAFMGTVVNPSRLIFP